MDNVLAPLLQVDPARLREMTAYDTVGRASTVTSSGRQVSPTYDLASRITRITGQVSGALYPSITVNRGPVVGSCCACAELRL
jgi:hypothetical protein